MGVKNISIIVFLLFFTLSFSVSALGDSNAKAKPLNSLSYANHDIKTINILPVKNMNAHILSDSAPVHPLEGTVYDAGSYKYICYSFDNHTYKMNLTHNLYYFNCSIENISSDLLRLICDSIFDGNGDGHCSSGESCVGYEFANDHYNTIAVNSEDFSWSKPWQESINENNYTHNKYISDRWFLAQDMYNIDVVQEEGSTCATTPVILSVMPPSYEAYNTPIMNVSLVTDINAMCYASGNSSTPIDEMIPFDITGNKNHQISFEVENGMIYTSYFKCLDPQTGMVSDTLEYMFVTDFNNPLITIIQKPEPIITENKPIFIEAEFSDNDSGFYLNESCEYCLGQAGSCSQESNWYKTQNTTMGKYGNGTCSQQFNSTYLINGQYEFGVRIKDSASNVGKDLINFVINITTNQTINVTNNQTNLSTNTTLENLSYTPYIDWLTYYGGKEYDAISDIKETIDGGFIAIVTIEASINPVYSRNTYYGLVKTSANGVIEWEHIYANDNNDSQFADSVIQTNDGGYALSGRDKLIKTDFQGNVEWSRNIDYYKGRVVKQTLNGDYILAGLNPQITRISSKGDLIWTKSYAPTGFIFDFQITQDQGYVLAGHGSSGVWILKTDSNGNKLWDLNLGGGDDTAYKIKELHDGNYILSAQTGQNLWLIKINVSGKVVWSKVLDVYSYHNDYVTYSIDEAFDGGFILSGGGTGSDVNSYREGFLLFKTDSEGNMTWNMTLHNYYLKQETDYYYYLINSIHQTSDYGIILGGEISNDGWDTNGVIVKLNYNFNCTPNFISNNSWSECANKDFQTSNYFDTNSCGFSSPEPARRFCDYCLPNWSVTNYSSCRPDDRIYALNVKDTNKCFNQTDLLSDNYSGDYSEFIQYCDYNNDGFIGNVSNMNTSNMNITITSNNITNIISFMEENNPFIEFYYDLTQNKLNLFNITLEKQNNLSQGNYIIIKGIDLTILNGTKTIYLNRIQNGTGVCIRDIETSSISEVSGTCSNTNEVWINCPGINADYNCSFFNNDTQYKITGLKHSAVEEQSTHCGDGICNGVESCSSCSVDCGACPKSSGGGGGSGSGSSSGGDGSGGGGGGAAINTDVTIDFNINGSVYSPDKNQNLLLIYSGVNHTIYISDIYTDSIILHIDDTILNVSMNQSVKYTLDSNSILDVKLIKLYGTSAAGMIIKLDKSVQESTKAPVVNENFSYNTSTSNKVDELSNLVTGNAVKNPSTTSKVGTGWIIAFVVFVVVLGVGIFYLNMRHKHNRKK